MQHVKTVVVDGKALEYFLIDSDEGYGILARYEGVTETVFDISEDFDFVYDLADSLAESFTMPEFIEDLCEEAMFEAAFVELIEEEK